MAVNEKDYQDYQEFMRYRAMASGPRSMPPRQEPPPSGEDVARGVLHNTGQGATFGFSDEMQGVAEGLLRREEGETYDDAYIRGRDAERAKIAEGRADAPALSATGDMAGGLGSGGAAFKLAGAPNTLAGSAVFGGTEGLIDAAGRSESADDMIGDMIKQGPAGALLGAGGFSASEIYNRFRRSAGDRKLGNRVAQAEELGVELTPAQKYSDPALHRFEASQVADPGYGKAFDDMQSRNQSIYNRVAADTIGIDADKLTELEMGEAARNISKKFKEATDTGDIISFDESWMDDLGELEAQYRKVWGKSGASPKIIDDILETTEAGFITPEEYQRRYSQLGKDLESARTAGDMHKIELYSGLRRALDDIVDRNAAGLSDQFKEARKLYKNKLLLQKPGVVRTETGNISPKVLANKLQKDTRGYLEGENTSPLYNVARVGKGVDSGIGDSGTATRSKDMIDFLTAPAKERMAQAYLSGRVGQNVFGPSTGKGGAMNPFIYSLMQSPEAMEAVLAEEERRNQ